MTDNIVDLNSRRTKPTLPQPVVDALKEIEQKAALLREELDEHLLKFADEHGKPIDISIPLEALILNFAQIASDLDTQVLPEVLNEHHEMRMQLAEQLNQTIQRFSAQQDSPIYSQDIYIGLATAAVSYTHQHRIYGLLKGHAENEKQGDESND